MLDNSFKEAGLFQAIEISLSIVDMKLLPNETERAELGVFRKANTDLPADWALAITIDKQDRQIVKMDFMYALNETISKLLCNLS